jgi:cation diffusion facilitator family transporter
MASVGLTSDDTRGQSRTALLSLLVASGLVALKLGVGLAGGSLGLVSAGIESSGDVVAALLTFFAVRLGGRPADRGHPYGHRRAENLGALGEAFILLAGAVLVTTAAVDRLAEGHGPGPARWYEFAVVGTAILLDATRTGASLRASKRYASAALRGNALHFAGDLVGSVAVLGGLVGVLEGAPAADAVAALVVALIILIATVRLMAENANVLMDRAPWEARSAAERAIRGVGEGIELSRLRLRESAGRYFADVVVSVPAGQALVEGHRSADLVEQAIERALPGSDVIVHVEPRARGLELRDRVLAIALSEPLVKEAHDISVFEHDGRSSVSLHLKFPADLGLREAHEVAERVEEAIRARPGVGDVQTHLEPLEQTLPAAAADAAAERRTAEAAEALVRERTGSDPRRLRILSTASGQILFLTLGVGPAEPLAGAHALAGELEEELRRRVPGLADVVVHTEP